MAPPSRTPFRRSPTFHIGRTMPLHHHGGTPHTKSQQRKRTDDEVTLEQATGHAEHDVNAEPFDNGRWERAVDDHIAGYRPAPTTGGTLSEASEINERLRALAAQLEECADVSTISAEVLAAGELVADHNVRLLGMLDGDSALGPIEQAGGAAINALHSAVQAIEAWGQAIGSAAGEVAGRVRE